MKSLRHRMQHLPSAPRLIHTALLLVAAIVCLVYAIISVEVTNDGGPFVVCATLFAICVVAGLTITSIPMKCDSILGM